MIQCFGIVIHTVCIIFNMYIGLATGIVILYHCQVEYWNNYGTCASVLVTKVLLMSQYL